MARIMWGALSLGIGVTCTVIGIVAPVQDAPRWQWALFWAIAGVVTALIPWMGLDAAHVSLDPRTREVVLERVGWRGRRVVRTFPLARVTDAIVRADPDPTEGAHYMVFLVVEGEEPVSLMAGTWTSGRERCEKAAVEIRALLGK
jgi:hypothetical protein